MKKQSIPSMDAWLAEARSPENGKKIGMYLIHNGVVRETARAKVRQGKEDTRPVMAMEFSYDAAKVEEAVADTYKMEGISFIRTWLAEGRLAAGDDIMFVLVGGDIRPHVIDGLQYLVGRLKEECVTETEIYEVETCETEDGR